jgi:C4-type Zn-finger protein
MGLANILTFCPHCGKDIEKPIKKLENPFFSIVTYSCDSCGKHFKDLINQSYYS